jgi:hypothetical protein
MPVTFRRQMQSAQRDQPADTSTWGKRLVIRPGVSTAAGGSGIGPDIGMPKRLLDIRAPTSEPGFDSRPIAIYVTARPIFDASFAGTPNGRDCRFLDGRLETGSGGVTRAESFGIPAVGKAMHIGCDSLRLEVAYRPGLVAPDDVRAMVGWELIANGSISGVDPAPQVQELFSSAAPSLPVLFEIPLFAQKLSFDDSASTGYRFAWLDRFGEPAGLTPFEAAAQYGVPDGRAFPIAATQLAVSPTVAVVGLRSAAQLRWGRHS